MFFITDLLLWKGTIQEYFGDAVPGVDVERQRDPSLISFSTPRLDDPDIIGQ